jgi:flagellar basal body-associated protein FliL
MLMVVMLMLLLLFLLLLGHGVCVMWIEKRCVCDAKKQQQNKEKQFRKAKQSKAHGPEDSLCV